MGVMGDMDGLLHMYGGAMMWDADRDRGYGIVFEMGM